MMEKEAKIYVAGHRGMLCSAIVRELPYSYPPHVELDLTRQEVVERFFEAERPKYVFLAAAKVEGLNHSALADIMYDNMILEMNVIHAVCG